MIGQWLAFAVNVTSWIFLVFLMLSTVLRASPALCRTKVNLVWRIAKWLSLLHPPVTLFEATVNHHFNGWTAIGIVVDSLLWWFLRDVGDDDTARKLKKKITEKVEVVAGRLVVVPQTGTA